MSLSHYVTVLIIFASNVISVLRRIFSRDFHRGYEGLTPEQRREIFGYEDDDIDQDIEAIATFADGEDITDYDVEAFVDEDQLFE